MANGRIMIPDRGEQGTKNLPRLEKQLVKLEKELSRLNIGVP
jgi:hypothetical protein